MSEGATMHEAHKDMYLQHAVVSRKSSRTTDSTLLEQEAMATCWTGE